LLLRVEKVGGGSPAFETLAGKKHGHSQHRGLISQAKAKPFSLGQTLYLAYHRESFF
jgi:hypothetical protein|tara:strand:- start:1000 stop:1170 length:171 start_codon:yes stop_codon:yes gene_type:complete